MQETTFEPINNGSSVSYQLLFLENFDFQGIISNVTCHQAFLDLQNILDYKFKDLSLFIQAMTHPSFQNEHSKFVTNHYERLEFLGDSFIGLSISTILLVDFSDSPEGELSKMRASLVNKTSLSQLASLIKLDQLVLVGKGEVQNNGMKNDSIMADTFEALFGAIYLEAGFDRALVALKKLIEFYSTEKEMSFIDLSRLSYFDYKSRLQEETMALCGLVPEYRECSLINETQSAFTIEIYIGKELYGTNTAHSKKIAKNNLAEKTFKEKKYIQN